MYNNNNINKASSGNSRKRTSIHDQASWTAVGQGKVKKTKAAGGGTSGGGTSARGTPGHGGRSTSARANSGGTAVALARGGGGGFKSMASTLQDGYAPHNPFPYSPQARQAKNQKSSPIHRSARKILPSSSTHSRGTRRSTQALSLSSSSPTSGAGIGGRAPSNSSALELNNGLPDDQALALALKNSASAPTSTLNHHPAPKENRSPQSKPAKRSKPVKSQSNQVNRKRSLFRELFLDVVYYYILLCYNFANTTISSTPQSP
jgi:hypothetical protein